MDQLNQRGLNQCFTNGLLTATGAETVYDTTVTITYCINGKILAKTAITDGATPTTDGTTALGLTLVANQAAMVVWTLRATTVKCYFGPVVSWDGTVATPMPAFPSIPDTDVPFAYQFCKAGSTAGTIVFGTSNWNATGFSNAIVNLSTLPRDPQIS